MDTPAKSCSAFRIPGVRCPNKVVATITLPVPGGTIRGHTCQAHGEIVRRMVRDEAERRSAAGARV
jgi:hypothetical protein